MTAAGDALSRQHRQALLQLRNLTIADLVEIWPAFRLDDVEGTWPAFAAAARTVIANRRTTATRIGGAFVTAHRIAETNDPNEAPVQPATPLDVDRLDGTLALLGPVMLRRSFRRGVPNPADLMLTRIAGTATRLVLEGDRDTVARTLRSDRRAVGWKRETSGSPCDFCADLADRITRADDDSVGFPAHDHCGCTAVPIYR